MPKYRVKEKSLIGNELFEEGAIVDYDGLPAENLEPQCEEGEAKYQEYLASNAARVAAMKSQFNESAVGDPAAFAKAMATAQAETMAALPGMISEAVAQALATAFPNGTAKPAAKQQESNPLV